MNGGPDERLLAGRLKLAENVDKRVLTQKRARCDAVAMRAVHDLALVGGASRGE